MRRVLDLRALLTVAAFVEFAYMAISLFTPPGEVRTVTGWVLSPDGQWIAKLLGVALGSQAWVAWIMRKAPHPGVVTALAAYQIGSATVDWVLWIDQSSQGIFSTALASPGDRLHPPALHAGRTAPAGEPAHEHDPLLTATKRPVRLPEPETNGPSPLCDRARRCVGPVGAHHPSSA